MSEQSKPQAQNEQPQDATEEPQAPQPANDEASVNGAAPDASSEGEPISATDEAQAAAATDDSTSDSPEAEDERESPDPLVLQAELEAAQQRADEYYEQLQRVTAEFRNARQRQEKQLNESIERSSQRIIIKLLPVLDDLDLAFQNIPEDLTAQQTAWLDGFSQIQQKLQALLDSEGVKAIETTGKFDPDLHEAISSEPSEDVESEHIIATLRTGYAQRGRVLRPALVRVAA